MKRRFILLGVAATLAVSLSPLLACAQDAAEQSARGNSTGMSNSMAAEEISVALIGPFSDAEEGQATVRVETRGVRLVDPDAENEAPVAGEAHIHYHVDDGPVTATTANEFEIHNLPPGKHHIMVQLAGNDHQPIGNERTLVVRIPEQAEAIAER